MLDAFLPPFNATIKNSKREACYAQLFMTVCIVMNIYNSSKSNGASNVQWSNTSQANEQWQITAVSSTGITVQSLYTIKNKNSGMVLDIKADSKGNFASESNQCIQNSSNGASDQKWLIENATPWNQTQFEIGSWSGPLFTATELQKFKAANFNTINAIDNGVSNGGDPLFTNPTFMNNTSNNPREIQLSSSSLPPFYDYSNVCTQPVQLPMEQCLSLLKSVGGLKMLVQNGWDINNNFWDVNSLMYDFYSVKLSPSLGPINTDYVCSQDAINTTTFYKNFSQYRAQMLGYWIGDEPGTTTAVTRAGLIKDNLAAADPGMLGYVNFPSTGASWGTYQTYVDYYLNSPNTKAVTFDYYVLGNTGYEPCGLGYCAYFQHLNLFASTIQKYNNKAMFWGNIGSSCQQIGWGNQMPTEQTLRYYVSTNLIYGSKGMNWYVYNATTPSDIPYAINNNSTIYSLVQKVNGELAKMGPTLIGLNWAETVHGLPIDPCSGESNLNIVIDGDPYFDPGVECNPYSTDPYWNVGYSAIGVLKPSSGPDLANGVYYLIVMNKDLEYEGEAGGLYYGNTFNINYTVKTTVKTASQFNKTTGAWNSLGIFNAYCGTGFQVTVGPGDCQLIKIVP
ncbi:MAG: RICIN domain-containing protein [Chitinivibrionales bacterium]